jgi:hypothetical protein
LRGCFFIPDWNQKGKPKWNILRFSGTSPRLVTNGVSTAIFTPSAAMPGSRKWQSLIWIRSLKTSRPSARKANRLPYCYITGGDPILHPQFWALAEKLKTENIPFAILGNPFHLNDAVCKRLHDYGCRKYQLSLDGLRETHDRIRRPGSYDETLAAVPILRNAGIDVAIMATVSPLELQRNSLPCGCCCRKQGGHFRFWPVLPVHVRPGQLLLTGGISRDDGTLLGKVRAV